MIPKKIHYCWFGGNPLPEEAKKYIDTWKKYCKGYEIIEWNEKNFDLSFNRYVKEAYESKKWAFITDYVRLYVLYKYGGIYMDTDVEVLKPLDVFLDKKGFSGFESNNTVPTGIMASEKENSFIAYLLDDYEDRAFIKEDGSLDLTTNVELITKKALEKGLILNNSVQDIGDYVFYPNDYFCPKDSRTLDIVLTDNTYTIHHFAGSWMPKKNKFYKIIKKVLGPKNMRVLLNVVDKIKGNKI